MWEVGSPPSPGELYLPLPPSETVAGEVLPWLAMRGGKPLSPTGLPGEAPPLSELIADTLKRHRKLLLWDVDGIERGRPQLELYRRFEGRGLWVDAGVDNLEGFIDVIVAGAEVAVLNLRTLTKMAYLQEAGKMTEKLAVCVEEGDGVVTRDRRIRYMRPQDLFREAQRSGITKGVYLRDSGLQAAPDWVETTEGISLYSGPVSSFKGLSRMPSWRAVVDVYELI